MRMPAGAFDRRVKIQSIDETENSLGEVLRDWVDGQTLSAAISYGAAAERRQAAIEESHQAATFTLRSSTYTKAIRPTTHRLVFEGQVFDIASAVPSVTRGDTISITATARTS